MDPEQHPVVLAPADLPRPTGGTTYDVRLAGQWGAHPLWLGGSWPDPSRTDVECLRIRLAALRDTAAPTGPPVLVDGIIGCAAPEVVREAVAAGQRVWLLVHLPLPAETGLDPVRVRALARSEEAAVTGATGVIVPSHWARQDLLRRYGPLRVAVAEPGTDPVTPPVDHHDRASGLPVLFTPAAFSTRKNHHLLLDVLTSLADLPWTARWVGPHPPGGTAGTLSEEVRRRGLDERIGIEGPLTGAALAQAWRGADLLLLASVAETYAMVVAEALSHGIPAVVAAGTAAEDTLCGPGLSDLPGAAVDPASAPGWTTVLRAWLTDEELRDTWRDRARARAESGTLTGWDDTALRVLHAVSRG